MGLFTSSDKYGPSHTEPNHFKELRKIADKAAAKAAEAAKDADKGGKDGKRR